MIIQTKMLKGWLKKYNITSKHGSLKVRVQMTKGGCYGSAVTHVRALTDDEIIALKNESEYVGIYNNVECDFAIITYPE